MKSARVRQPDVAVSAERSAVITLLQPPGTCADYTRSGSKYPPLGLCLLAAACPDQAIVLDAEGEGLTDAEIEDRLKRSGAVAVGMTVTSFTLELAERWASRCKQLGLQVIAGGPHATLRPRDLLTRCPSVDILVRGDGEEVFPELVKRIRNGEAVDEVPGVVTRATKNDGEVLRVGDLDEMPLPSFEGLPIQAYRCPDSRRAPMVTFITSKGCPFSCAFCASSELFGRKVRTWSVPRVIEKLEELVHVRGVREVSFVDDGFTVNPRRAFDLCTQMIERRLDLSWFCNVRADQVTPELARVMARAGCHQAYLGLESGSQRILDGVGKGSTVEQMERGARALAEAGIHRSAGFVVGLPGEDESSVDATIAMANRIRPQRIQFTRWTPLPGSRLEGASGAGANGFHDSGEDQVASWMEHCYAECRGDGWGARSW